MTTISSTTGSAGQTPFNDAGFDEAQLAAASFLARYSGRTLEAYRQDLRGFFQWAADHDVPVLAATRPHIELWRGSMEERELAASTIDRRLSTVCGFYRFAHIDGRIGSNPGGLVVGGDDVSRTDPVARERGEQPVRWTGHRVLRSPLHGLERSPGCVTSRPSGQDRRDLVTDRLGVASTAFVVFTTLTVTLVAAGAILAN